MATKNLYCGEFNFRRQMTVLYCYAYTERQAWATMCNRIAKRDGVSPRVVLNYFNREKDNYKISIEMEVKEDAQ